MEVIIKGEAKEIAALVLAVQERQRDFDIKTFCDSLENHLEKSIVESAENICLYRKS